MRRTAHVPRASRAPLLATLLALAAAGCDREPEPPPEPPTLVVMVTVDQLRTDLVTRYDSLFTGGLRRLLDEGLFYTGASHRHAYTSTAPGHATLATAVHPSRHGIVANTFVEVGDSGQLTRRYAVEDTLAPIVGFPGLQGRSPATLERDGVADWVLAADTGSRVLAVSKKDRGAIPLGGRRADAERVHVYWMNLPALRVVTSAFYRDTYPSWVERFNRETMPALLADTVWMQSTPEPWRALARPDASPYEADGEHVTFPHRQREESRDDDEGRNGWYEITPFPDRALVAFVDTAVAELQLGQRGVLDFLSVSFSQTDHIGHRYGPLSQEQLDNLLHLDRVLDELLTLLDARVGEGRWVLGLSADHGVLTIPEHLAEQGVEAHRADPGYAGEVARRVQEVVESGVEGDTLLEQVAASLEALPFIADVLTPAELRSPADSFAPLYRNSHHPTRRDTRLPQFDLMVRPAERWYLTSSRTGTSHGSPYWYDRQVPLVLLGAGVQAGRSDAEAYTVDLVPTLARLVELEIPADLDGRVLEGGG
ncbi:MAG: alkaline phosphatase family protein [Phycisphaerales bacterium]